MAASKLVRRSLLFIALALALAACAHRQAMSEANKKVLAKQPGTLVASTADRWAPDCPVAVPGTEVVITDLDDGASLTLTTRVGDVQELRRRAMNLAAEYNAGYDRPAPPARVRYVEAPRITQGGGYGIGGDEGSKELRVPGRPPSRAIVELVAFGARIHFRTTGKAEAERVRYRAAREAVQMWAGSCPTVG